MNIPLRESFNPKSLYETAVFYVRSGSLSTRYNANLRSAWEESLVSSDQVIFFYHAIIKSLHAYVTKNYTLFDAHTTTNCCHGIAVFAREQVLSISHLDIEALKEFCLAKIEQLKSGSNAPICTRWIPDSLFNLAALYVLANTRTFSEKKCIQMSII